MDEIRATDTPRPSSGSPRPTFDCPTVITHASVTRHVWGDPEAGEVADWIYASTSRIHALVFGLPPGGAFRHSEAYRTVFAADEVFHVLSGIMVIANPQTGEVHRVPAGGRVAFGRDTWHHAFAHGPEPLRVLELFAPPPSAGTSSKYAREQDYLEHARYAVSRPAGEPQPSDGGASRRTLRVIREQDVVWRRDLGVLIGTLEETPQLSVSTLELNPGDASAVHAHGGDEVLYVVGGTMWVRAWQGGEAFVFELEAGDACYLPLGADHEYRNYAGGMAEAVIGVAPRFDP